MKTPNPMDITDFLTDLEGGMFAAIVGRAIQAPMYVNQDGSVSIVPASQTDLFKKKTDHA